LRQWAERIDHPARIKKAPPPIYVLSSRPKRTRIFYYAAPTIASRAAFRKESRMKFAKATKLYRKSGVAQ
jgi:hypothetical protein